MEVRLNKLISDSGLCSRREADRFIEMGRVTVNGQLPEPGKKVNETDIILVDENRIRVGKSMDKEGMRAVSGKAKNLIFGNDGQKKSEASFRLEGLHKAEAPQKAEGARNGYTPQRNTETPRKTEAPHKPSAPKEDSSHRFEATRRGETPLKNETPSYASESKPRTGVRKDETLRRTDAPYKKGARKTFSDVAEEIEGAEGGSKRSKYGKYNKYAAARKAAGGEVSKARRDTKEAADYAKALKEAKNPKFGKSLSRSAVAQRMAAAPKSAALRKTSKNNPENKAKRMTKRNWSKGE